MRCNICDKKMSEKEISYNDDMKAYEPCTVCLDIAMDAAYSGDFKHDDEMGRVYTIVDEDFDSGTDFIVQSSFGNLLGESI